MKVVSRKEITVVSTDSHPYNDFQRIDGERWMVLIGNSWETVIPELCRRLELAYQEFLRNIPPRR